MSTAIADPEKDTPPGDVKPDDAAEREPKARKPRSDAGQPRGPRKRRTSKLAPNLSAAFHMAAAALVAIDPFDAVVIGANADKLANAWAPVIEKNPRLLAAIANLEKGGVWGAAILTTAGVVLPILAHHKPDILPEPLRGMASAMAMKYSGNGIATHAPAGGNGAHG